MFCEGAVLHPARPISQAAEHDARLDRRSLPLIAVLHSALLALTRMPRHLYFAIDFPQSFAKLPTRIFVEFFMYLLLLRVI